MVVLTRRFEGRKGGGSRDGWIMPKQHLLLLVIVMACRLVCVQSGCRTQDDKCDPVCVKNPLTNEMECNLRAILIFTNSSDMEASLQKMQVIWDLSLQKISDLKLLPDNLNIVGTFFDDRCDQSRALISVMDGHFNRCGDVIFGPVCDYALATVGRLAKYLHSEGTPVITNGGHSYEFFSQRTTCEDEFFMLVRTGFLSYKSLALFTVDIFNTYKWKKIFYFYERDGRYSISGSRTCHLAMNTLAKYHTLANISYSSYATDHFQDQQDIKRTLEREVGYDHSNAFIGLICKYVLAPISRFSGVWGIPVITPGGLSEAFNLKETHYPTLTRMMGSYGHVSLAINTFLRAFNWRKIGLLYHNHAEESGRGYSDCHNSLSSIFRAVNSSAYHRSFDELSSSGQSYKDMLRRIQVQARIIILCANATTIREIMLAAEELEMVSSGEYVFFNVELYSSMSESSAEPWYDANDDQERNQRAKEAFTALLTVTTKAPNQSEYLQFSDDVKALAKEKYNFSFHSDEPISIFVAAFYDAVILYANALRDYIQLTPNALEKPLNGTRITELMWNRTIHGITGDITMTENGDRVSDYSLLDMDPETGKFVVVANYIHNRGIEYIRDKIHWSGGRETPPADQPVCGFDGSLCPDKSLHGYAILSLFLGGTMVLFAVLFAIAYRRYKLETAINSMTWKVNWDDVLPCNPSSNHRGSVYSMGRRGSQATLYSEDIAGSLPGDRQLYINVGFYKGNKVAIKAIDPMNIVLDRKQLLELKQLKDIQNDHLVRFYGACVDAPNCYILTEYCPKGSLQDILENDQIKLDWMFKLSLMHDIIRGMFYLHNSQIGSHGSLKSSNCVVDSRFVLKITDFGLYGLRRDRNEDKESYSYWKNQLWTAPELLRMPYPPEWGTQKGDIYSFAIICHEIVTRQGPFYLGFSDDDLSPYQIVEKVKKGPLMTGAPPFRPAIDDCTIDDIKTLMEVCWQDCPTDRPDFKSLKYTIRKINKENESGNILDNLLHRMEQYAINLESLVDERTRDYLEEKKKCEDVLYQLLPRSVAAQLIMGKSVMAETYDQVTIYFSDIVGFTKISAESTPMQVVDFLNDLYTCFDGIVGHFDVYKVETIGDAYMVVSGLPQRNGIKHAREIARMSLALLKAVHTFKIRHRPDEQLRLRIGLHSGPCVAGVIGLKMPRYCLFGDTVNTASRMESNGEALKIHLSRTTKELLDEYGTFELEERGLLDVKGKGQMKTYWLLGEKEKAAAAGEVVAKTEGGCGAADCDNRSLSNGHPPPKTGPNGGLMMLHHNHSSNNNINHILNKNLVKHLPTSGSHSYLLNNHHHDNDSSNNLRATLLKGSSKNKKVQMNDDSFIQVTTPLLSHT